MAKAMCVAILKKKYTVLTKLALSPKFTKKKSPNIMKIFGVKVTQNLMFWSKSSGHAFTKILSKSNENSGCYCAKRDVGTTYPEVKGQRSTQNG